MEVLRLVKEETYGVYDTTTPVQDEIFLPVGNAFTVRTNPTFWTVTDASRGNRLVRMNVARKPVGGTLQTYGFPSQMAFLLDFAAGLVGEDPCLDLPSFSADYAQYGAGCVPIRKRYLGNKFGGFTLRADSSDQGCILSVNADVVGSTVADIASGDLPELPLTSYPTDDPYIFFEVAGHLTIGGARTNFQSLEVSIANVTKSFMDENQFAQKVQYFGRTVTFNAKLLLKSDADRILYEAGTPQAVSIQFVKGSNTLTLDLQGMAKISSLADDVPLDDFATQTIGMTALVDPATGTDFSYTVV
jgi:hypothetical protein